MVVWKCLRTMCRDSQDPVDIITKENKNKRGEKKYQESC